MERELRKCLTQMRRIQDKVFSFKGRFDMDIMVSSAIGKPDINHNVEVRCYQFNADLKIEDRISFIWWEEPHGNEVPYDEAIAQVKEFFGLTDK